MLPAPRGSILDRNGNELAVGKPQQTVYATPYLLDDPKAAADELCDALQINRRRDRRDVEEALSDGESGFAYVARKVDPELARAALKLDLPGVGSYAEEERTYPLKGTAAQVVGFAGMDNIGLFGIELAVRGGTVGRGRQRDRRARPRGTHAQDRRAGRAAARRERLPHARPRDPVLRRGRPREDRAPRRGQGGHGHRHGPAHRRGPRHGQRASAGIHVFGKDDEARKNRAVDRRLRARLHLQAGDDLRRARRRHREAEHDLQRALAGPGGRPHDRRLARRTPPSTTRCARSCSSPATWAPSRSPRRWARTACSSGSRRSASASRPASTSPASPQGIVRRSRSGRAPPSATSPWGRASPSTPIQMASAFSTVANNGWQVKPRLVAQVGDGGARRRSRSTA